MDKSAYKKFERIFKGMANRRRMQNLNFLEKEPGQAISAITGHISLDFRTTSENLRKMDAAGLVMKRHDGPSVRHALTKRGHAILYFCRNTE